MFARIMAVVMAAILITAVCLSAIWWFTLRNQQIDARLEYLISEAEDMAYLAVEFTERTPTSYLDRVSSTVLYLMGMKAEKVYEEFGGYIAIVDRAGNIMDNLQAAYSEDPDFFNSLSEDPFLHRAMKSVSSRASSIGQVQIPDVPVNLEAKYSRRTVTPMLASSIRKTVSILSILSRILTWTPAFWR